VTLTRLGLGPPSQEKNWTPFSVLPLSGQHQHAPIGLPHPLVLEIYCWLVLFLTRKFRLLMTSLSGFDYRIRSSQCHSLWVGSLSKTPNVWQYSTAVSEQISIAYVVKWVLHHRPTIFPKCATIWDRWDCMKHAKVSSVATHATQPQTTKTGHLASARLSRRTLGTNSDVKLHLRDKHTDIKRQTLETKRLVFLPVSLTLIDGVCLTPIQQWPTNRRRH